MARGRILSETISTSEKVSQLVDEDPRAACLWFMLLAKLDDFGRQDGVPKLVKATAAPLCESLTVPETERCLDELERRGLIARYSPEGWDGKTYLEFPEFERFQRFERGREARFPGRDGTVERIARAPRKRGSAKSERVPATQRRKEGRKELPSPSSGFPSGRLSQGASAPPVGEAGSAPAPSANGGPPAGWEDRRTYPPEIVRYEPHRTVKVGVELRGRTLAPVEVTVSEFGGFGSAERGVFEWLGWEPNADARMICSPEEIAEMRRSPPVVEPDP